MSEIHGEAGKEKGRGKSFCAAHGTAQLQHAVKILQENLVRKYKRLSDTYWWAKVQKSSARRDTDVNIVKIPREMEQHKQYGWSIPSGTASQNHPNTPGCQSPHISVLERTNICLTWWQCHNRVWVEVEHRGALWVLTEHRSFSRSESTGHPRRACFWGISLFLGTLKCQQCHVQSWLQLDRNSTILSLEVFGVVCSSEHQGTMQSFRLEKPSKIPQAQPQPTHHAHYPCPSLPHLHSSGAPPVMVTPPLLGSCAHPWPLFLRQSFS